MSDFKQKQAGPMLTLILEIQRNYFINKLVAIETTFKLLCAGNYFCLSAIKYKS